MTGALQLAELRAEQNKLNREKVDLENQLEAEQVLPSWLSLLYAESECMQCRRGTELVS